MLFVKREVVVMRPSAVYGAGGIHARRLAHTVDAKPRGGAECVVAAHDVVIMHLVIRMPAGRWDRGKVYERVASAQRLLKIGVMRDVHLDKRNLRPRRVRRWRRAVHAYDAVILRQR